MKNSKTKTKLSFKKIMSMILSIMMILSMTAGVDFSAFADEETVESISFELSDDFSLMENANGEYEGCEEEHDHDEYYRYYNWRIIETEGNKLIVNYSTGTTKEFIYQWYYEEDEDYSHLVFVSEDGEMIDADCLSFYDSQWSNHWGIGEENELTIEYEGVSTTVNVPIVENPIESISFEFADEFSLMENTNGDYEDCEVEHDHDQFFRYYTWNLLANEGNKLTVNYKTGDTKVYTYQKVYDEYDDGDYFFVAEDGEILDENLLETYDS